MSIKRRDFLLASLGVAEMAPIWTPPGMNPFDPRQPRPTKVIPSKTFPPIQPKNPIYTQQSPASPVHLSASVILPSGSNGTVPPAALKNPMGQDMEILEIKFEVSGVIGAATDYGYYGATIACELVMGTHKITNGSIPVFCFGRAENLSAETKQDITQTILFSSYTWRLPRPLYVPAGAVVTPNFTHTGLVSNSLNVRVGYSARTVFAKPKMVYIPWVAKYSSKVFNPIESADVDSSTELDLVNPNPETFHLQRFVGRTVVNTATAKVEGPTALSSQYLLLRMTDSYGRPIIRSFTPFYSAFTPLTRSWEMDNGAELDPESYYLVNMRKDVMDFSADHEVDTAQAFISMVGWRERVAL